jgi:hypothetical protein
LSHKNLAIGTVAILVFSLLALLISSYTALQTINPIAALTAITVAIIGIIWFKKAN